MLLEFSVENFRSIKERVTLSMVATKDESLADNVISHDVTKLKKLRLLKSAAIYGPNASGKSNIIRAMEFVSAFILESHKNLKGKPINISPFKLDKSCRNEPSKFEIIFIKNNIKYVYGFSVNHEKVIKEYLYYYPKGKQALIFFRDEKGSRFTRDIGKQKSIYSRTLENSLYLSTSSNQNYKRCMDAMEWFTNDFGVIDPDLDARLFKGQTYYALESDEANKNFILKLLKESDLGIADISLSSEDIPNFDKIKEIFNDKFTSELINALEDGKVPKLIIYHSAIDGTKIQFEESEESGGFNQLVGLAVPFAHALQDGGVLIMDELDIRLHPHLTKHLIDLFNNPNINKKDAQLIFTTHNTFLLNSETLRRDQIWFTEKRPDQSTDLYSLCEFKPRKEENIEKRYLTGRYGAIPFLNDWSYQ